jgi:predicted kinase
MTTGLIGTGKSTIAEGVAAALALRLLSSDRIRKARAGLAPETPQRVAYGAGLYSAATSAQTYETLAALARAALQQGESVMVDAAFPKQAQRELLQAVAVEVGAECHLIECLVPETVIRERLEQRVRQPGTISDGRWAIFPQFQQNYEPVQEMKGACHIRLDATQPIESCIEQALAAIQKGRAEYDRD